MKNALWWLAGIAVLSAIGGGVWVLSRGLRNNNPGNIRLSADQWRGLSGNQTDSSFFQFVAPLWGIRAIAVILRNYQDKYNLRTVAEMIERWAPPTENDTGNYANHVAALLGVDKNATIDVHIPATMTTMTKAIIRHENGVNPYDDALIDQAVFLALEGA